MNLVIKDIIGSKVASENKQGDLIFDEIATSLDKSEAEILLDFSGLKLITTAFLNNAIGKLYKNYEKEKLNNRLKIKNITDKGDVELLKLVILNAMEAA
ncbi:STAS-like domain-containing protein [Clostridium bornimense]|uniref:STAS-like domain-containing protein n=1 Tax=Clostridium bornimense TaxID=1216932 RepID=UPI001C10698C|nr:STAS-like domain-containing protein [Clostridium bornimense]MBU5316534.1 STAS-like domain-containing protein [Clostridium bornimense]